MGANFQVNKLSPFSLGVIRIKTVSIVEFLP